MSEICPKYKIGFDPAEGPDGQWLFIRTADGRVIHRSHSWGTTAGHLAFALDEIDNLDRQLAAAQAIVEKLPKTKDGVPVVPTYDHVWRVCDDGMAREFSVSLWRSPTEVRAEWRAKTCWDTGYGDHFAVHEETYQVAECYSTREASHEAMVAAARAGEQDV